MTTLNCNNSIFTSDKFDTSSFDPLFATQGPNIVTLFRLFFFFTPSKSYFTLKYIFLLPLFLLNFHFCPRVIQIINNKHVQLIHVKINSFLVATKFLLWRKFKKVNCKSALKHVAWSLSIYHIFMRGNFHVINNFYVYLFINFSKNLISEFFTLI